MAALAATGGVLALLAPAGSGGTGITALFLVAAPAAALAVPLRHLDLMARVALALCAAIVVDVGVAETMLALGLWSPSGGVLTVGVISALILPLAAWGRPRPPAGTGGGERDRAELPRVRVGDIPQPRPPEVARWT
jgi:hypothetical protein